MNINTINRAEDFIPSEHALFATYIASRNPKFKTHVKKGHAKSALCQMTYGKPRGGYLYVFTNDYNGKSGWLKIANVRSDMTREDAHREIDLAIRLYRGDI